MSVIPMRVLVRAVRALHRSVRCVGLRAGCV